jgi:hypothetical protein
MKDHLGHNYESAKVAAPRIRQELIQQLNPLHETQTRLSGDVEVIKTAISEVKGQEESVVHDIQASFEELQAILDNRKRELISEVSTQVERKVMNLSEQNKSLSAACASVQSVIEYTQQCVEHSADNDIIRMHTEISSRVRREVKEQQEEKRNLSVRKIAVGVEVKCAEDLKELCRTKAKLTVDAGTIEVQKIKVRGGGEEE